MVFPYDPLDNPRVTDLFGSFPSWRSSPHKGLDLVSDTSDNVYAIEGGTVDIADDIDDDPNGRFIRIQGDSGQFQTYYLHLSQVMVYDGEHVEAGELIGFMGNTGASTGKHLHLEVEDKTLGKEEIDPLPLLPFAAPDAPIDDDGGGMLIAAAALLLLGGALLGLTRS